MTLKKSWTPLGEKRPLVTFWLAAHGRGNRMEPPWIYSGAYDLARFVEFEPQRGICMTARRSWAAGGKCNRGRAALDSKRAAYGRRELARACMGTAWQWGDRLWRSDGRAQYGSSLYQSHEVTGQVASTVEALSCSSCSTRPDRPAFFGGSDHLNICCPLTWYARTKLDHATVWWSVSR